MPVNAAQALIGIESSASSGEILMIESLLIESDKGFYLLFAGLNLIGKFPDLILHDSRVVESRVEVIDSLTVLFQNSRTGPLD